MTWNVWWRHGPWEARQPAIEAVLRAEEPDVVCLQETWAEQGSAPQAAVLAARLGYHATWTDGPWFDGRSVANAVLSRWEIVARRERALPGAGGRPGHRRALAATLASPWGRWPVVSTHFEHRFDASLVRQAQARALAALVAEVRGDPEVAVPVVVGADLNAVPDSDELRLLTGRSAAPVAGLVLNDVWEQAGDGPGLTWDRANAYLGDAAWPGRRLDYLLVSWPRPRPLGNPQRAWLAGRDPVDGVQASDHAAVVAELHVPGR